MILKACACVRQGTTKGPGNEDHSKWAISIVPGKVCPHSTSYRQVAWDKGCPPAQPPPEPHRLLPKHTICTLD